MELIRLARAPVKLISSESGRHHLSRHSCLLPAPPIGTDISRSRSAEQRGATQDPAQRGNDITLPRIDDKPRRIPPPPSGGVTECGAPGSVIGPSSRPSAAPSVDLSQHSTVTPAAAADRRRADRRGKRPAQRQDTLQASRQTSDPRPGGPFLPVTVGPFRGTAPAGWLVCQWFTTSQTEPQR